MSRFELLGWFGGQAGWGGCAVGGWGGWGYGGWAECCGEVVAWWDGLEEGSPGVFDCGVLGSVAATLVCVVDS